MFDIQFRQFREMYRNVSDDLMANGVMTDDSSPLSDHVIEREAIRRIFLAERNRSPEIVSYSRMGDGRIQVLVRARENENRRTYMHPDGTERPYPHSVSTEEMREARRNL